MLAARQMLTPEFAFGADATPRSSSELPPLPPSPELPPAPAIALAESANAEKPAKVYVHIGTTDAVVLERYTKRYFDSEYLPLCTAPCDEWVPAEGQYRIAGTGVRPSMPFELRGARVDLHVAPASSSAYDAGKVVMIVGAVDVGVTGGLLVAGILLSAVIGPFADGPPDSGGPSLGANQAVVDLAIAAGVGAVLMGVGIPLMALNDRTHVSQSGGAAPVPVSSQPRASWDDVPLRRWPRMPSAGGTFPVVTIRF
jgi:hypothetical protein